MKTRTTHWKETVADKPGHYWWRHYATDPIEIVIIYEAKAHSVSHPMCGWPEGTLLGRRMMNYPEAVDPAQLRGQFRCLQGSSTPIPIPEPTDGTTTAPAPDKLPKVTRRKKASKAKSGGASSEAAAGGTGSLPLGPA